MEVVGAIFGGGERAGSSAAICLPRAGVTATSGLVEVPRDTRGDS